MSWFGDLMYKVGGLDEEEDVKVEEFTELPPEIRALIYNIRSEVIGGKIGSEAGEMAIKKIVLNWYSKGQEVVTTGTPGFPKTTDKTRMRKMQIIKTDADNRVRLVKKTNDNKDNKEEDLKRSIEL